MPTPTIRKARNHQRAPADETQFWDLPFVDGRTITVYAQQVRSAQQMYETSNPYARDPATTPTIPPVPLSTDNQHTDPGDGDQQPQTQDALRANAAKNPAAPEAGMRRACK
jgi:hypothetical protein